MLQGRSWREPQRSRSLNHATRTSPEQLTGLGTRIRQPDRTPRLHRARHSGPGIPSNWHSVTRPSFTTSDQTLQHRTHNHGIPAAGRAAGYRLGAPPATIYNILDFWNILGYHVTHIVTSVAPRSRGRASIAKHLLSAVQDNLKPMHYFHPFAPTGRFTHTPPFNTHHTPLQQDVPVCLTPHTTRYDTFLLPLSSAFGLPLRAPGPRSRTSPAPGPSHQPRPSVTPHVASRLSPAPAGLNTRPGRHRSRSSMSRRSRDLHPRCAPSASGPLPFT